MKSFTIFRFSAILGVLKTQLIEKPVKYAGMLEDCALLSSAFTVAFLSLKRKEPWEASQVGMTFYRGLEQGDTRGFISKNKKTKQV